MRTFLAVDGASTLRVEGGTDRLFVEPDLGPGFLRATGAVTVGGIFGGLPRLRGVGVSLAGGDAKGCAFLGGRPRFRGGVRAMSVGGCGDLFLGGRPRGLLAGLLLLSPSLPLFETDLGVVTIDFSFFVDLVDVGVPPVLLLVGETRRVETLLSPTDAALQAGQNHFLVVGTEDNGGLRQKMWYSSSHWSHSSSFSFSCFP